MFTFNKSLRAKLVYLTISDGERKSPMNHHYWSAAPCNNELINDIDLVTWIFSLLLSFFCSHSVHLILNISPSKNVISNIKFTLKRQTVFRARARRKRRKRQRTISSPLNFCNIKAKTYSKKQQIKTNFKDTVSSRDTAVCVCECKLCHSRETIRKKATKIYAEAQWMKCG